MSNDRNVKIYKAVGLVLILGTLTSGINYMVYTQKLMGIAFVINIAANFSFLFSYIVEKEKLK